MTSAGALRPLVIGYGSPLRGDDALGWRAALAVADDPRLSGVDVLARHQLTPELAVDVAAAARVVFIDSRDGRIPSDDGKVGVATVAASPAPLTWTHHLDAAALLGLTAELYGATPTAVLVTVPAVSFEVSDRLSADGERMLVDVVEVVAALLEIAAP